MGMFLQMMMWYLQLNDPKLIALPVPSQLRSVFIAVVFSKSFNQSLCFGHLFHNLKAFILPAIIK